MSERFLRPTLSFRFQSITSIELHLRSPKFAIIGLFDRLIYNQMLWKSSCHSRHIIFTNSTISDDLIDILQAFIVFGSDQDPRSIFIQPISKSRFKSLMLVLGIAHLFAVKLQIIIHTRIISMLRTRMDHDSRRLIEYEPVLIFIQNPSLHLI